MKYLNDTISLLSKLNIDEEEDIRLSRMILSNNNIKYLSMESDVVYGIDLLGIDYSIISKDVFQVMKVRKYCNDFLNVGDYLLFPETISQDEFSNKNVELKLNLNIVSREQHQFYKKEILISLKSRKNNYNHKEYLYFVFPDFENYNLNKEIGNDKKIIIDLRTNRGGSIKNMVNIFKRIFKTDVICDKIDENLVNFRLDEIKHFDNKVYIIVNELTASSSEIFSFLAKAFSNVKLIGKTTFGKDTICKKIKIGEISLSVPYYKYLIYNKQISEYKIDYVYENIDNVEFTDIVNICNNILRIEELSNE